MEDTKLKEVIVKLGGSLITHKDKPMSVNVKSLRKAVNMLKIANARYFLVHGGGSFGHFMASRFNLRSVSKTTSIEGISETKAVMQELNSWVLRILINGGFRPYTIPPQFLFKSWSLVRSLMKRGLTPLSHGDVVWDRGFRIISGDEIIKEAAKTLKPKIVIFAMKTPGILEDVKDENSLIKELEKRKLPSFKLTRYDVTGGVRRKIEIAFEIAKLGIDVIFVKGDSEELAKAIKGLPFRGTVVKGCRNLE